jgi:hypothetical protein
MIKSEVLVENKKYELLYHWMIPKELYSKRKADCLESLSREISNRIDIALGIYTLESFLYLNDANNTSYTSNNGMYRLSFHHTSNSDFIIIKIEKEISDKSELYFKDLE